MSTDEPVYTINSPEWEHVKTRCNKGIRLATGVCIDPYSSNDERLVAAGEAQAYQYILSLHQDREGD